MVNRIAGIASGMDTESIVKKLMDAEKIPLNKIYQNRQWKEWQKDAFRDVNSQLLDLRKSMENLRLQSSFNQSKVNSTDTTKVDVSISGTPSQSVYNITAATLYTPGTPSSLMIGTSLPDDTTELGTGQAFSFTLNGQTITLTDKDSIKSAISQINDKSSLTKVTASYSSVDKAIIFTGTDYSNQIIIGGTSLTPNKLGISNTTGPAPTPASPGQVTINGATITINSNNFTYDGINYTLKSGIASPVQVNKTSDVDSIFNSIKTFVDKYNEVIQSLNDKIDERRNRDYQPLLDDQKSAMKDSEITLWETKAKSGLLANDSLVSGILNNMRTTLYSTVTDPVPTKVNTKVDTLSEIGITTSNLYTDNGKLVLDETKLKGMLQTNLEDVKTLFTKTYDTGKTSDTTVNNSTKNKYSGLAWKLYDQLNDSMSKITSKAGNGTIYTDNSIIGKEISNLNQQISDWNNRLSQKEDMYWRQFNAMEQAIQKNNSQSAYIAQQFK